MSIKLHGMAVCTVLLLVMQPLRAESLRDIYTLALQNDAQLKAAEATFKADSENRQLARAALLPQLSLAGAYARVDTQLDNAGVYSESTLDRRTYSASLQQSLFDPAAWFNFKRGKLLSQQAEAEFAVAQQNLILRTSDTYFNVLRAFDNLSTADAEVRATKRQLEHAEQRAQVGLAPITDVLEARAVYDATVVRRLAEIANLGAAFEALTVLTNKDYRELSSLNKAFVIDDPIPADRNEWVEFALDKNYELQAARFATTASAQNAKAKSAEHMPKVIASYGYNDLSDYGDTRFPYNAVLENSDRDLDTGTLSVSINWALYSGGGISAGRRQAASQYQAAQYTLADTKRQLIQQTRSFYLAVVTDVQQVKAQAQAIVSAESALKATQAGYNAGTRNIVDLLQVQRNLYAAQRDYAGARYNYILDFMRLKRLAGTLSPEDIYNVDRWLVADSPAVLSVY